MTTSIKFSRTEYCKGWKNSKNYQGDHSQTPAVALNPLLPYLKKEWVIWEPAKGKGNLVKELQKFGFSVWGTDILTGHDFLIDALPFFDCIITNPPYSLKNQFLERCYELKKPFALLLPVTMLETRRRQNLFEKYGIEIILVGKRINFETPTSKGSGAGFESAWFTNGLNIGSQLTFSSLG